MTSEKRIGVFACWKRDKFDIQAALKKSWNGLKRCRSSWRIAVVGNVHSARVSREKVRLLGRERRAHRRDGIRGARAFAGNAVEVTLDEQNGVFLADGLFRAVEAVEQLALREARRLR